MPCSFFTTLLTERSIINALIWLAALIVVPYIAVSALYYNFTPFLVVLAICFFVVIFGVLKDRLCMLPLFGVMISGKLNFIPFKLMPQDLGAISLVAYYFVAYVALQRKIMKTGPMVFFIPILIFTSIVLYHEHNFGLRAFGGGREGSRGALFIMLGSLAYLCGVSVISPSPKFFANVPLIAVILGLVSALPYTLTTYFPGLAPYVLLFTNNINGSVLAAGGDDEAITRNSGQAAAAMALMAYLLAYYPMHTWFRPDRWWMALAGIACSALVVMGGFRSSFAIYILVIMVAAFCHYKWRALVLIPPLVLALFVLTAVQDSHLVSLPNSAQRTLDFLPGDWDPEVVSSTESSNDFRDKIKTVYLREELRKSPLFGNGFSYDSDEFATMTYLGLTQETSDGYYGTKIFIVGKMFHIGWISVYDAVGLVGSAAFVFLEVASIWVYGRDIFRRGVDHDSPFFKLRVWVFCSILPSFIGYFTVFGDIKESFPIACYFAILWTHLWRLERQGYIPPSTSTPELSFDPIKGEGVSVYS
jgi:hypothetical protein